jgi:hypothetical protein
MSFFDWFGRRKSDSERRLLESFLSLEEKRIASLHVQEDRRHELEIKKAEMEIEHAEELARVRREDREASVKLKQQQREWAAVSRAKKLAAASPKPGGLQSSEDCSVCAGRIDLQPSDISYHYSNHTNRGMDLFH